MKTAMNPPPTAEDVIRESQARLSAMFPGSMAQHEASRKYLPGGVTRGILQVDPFPLCIERAEGNRVTTVDGETLVDFSGDFGSGLLGHSNPVVQDAARAAIDAGFNFGGTSLYESRLAETLCNRFPSMERVRFCNSGTEANLMAILLAQSVTERRKIMVFDWGYHGGVFCFRDTLDVLNVPIPTVVGAYNDIDGARRLIEENADELACVVLEPMLGASASILASTEFLRMLREETKRRGIILMFDEVVTSRLSVGGYQKIVGVTPDLTAVGKYVGGGFAFGAFGGRADIMDRLDHKSARGVFHTGTHNNNPITMRTAFTAMSEVATQEAIDRVNALGDRLRDGFNALAQKHGVQAQSTGCGSLGAFHFRPGPITTTVGLAPEDQDFKHLFYLEMTQRGFYVSRRGSFTLSFDFEEEDIDAFLNAVDAFFGEHAAIFTQ